ncbi:MAG: PilZ domain-containing protein [Planctomycetes bacterium]|nr:PilZ domain-containing protein [Planctomycetota bacterium]
MKVTSRVSSNAQAREVLLRFLALSQRRCDVVAADGRRALRRHQRTWPLAVVDPRDASRVEAAALHDASRRGMAFLYPRAIEVGAVIRLRLFWYDEDCPLVVAVVRHRTPTKDGFLIGCEFLISLED